MLFRLNFDDQVCAALIGKIAERANGGSLNKALQTMVIEWNALENDKKLSGSRQVSAKSSSIEDKLDDALTDLEDAWE